MTIKTDYQLEDFPISMIIEAIISDKLYEITTGEAYEIIRVAKRESGLSIIYINDKGAEQTKLVNHPVYSFDRYFRIC